jgi:hypothetical protein
MTPSLVIGSPGDPKMAKRCNIVTRCIAAIALMAIEQAPQEARLQTFNTPLKAANDNQLP